MRISINYELDSLATGLLILPTRRASREGRQKEEDNSNSKSKTQGITLVSIGSVYGRDRVGGLSFLEGAP